MIADLHCHTNVSDGALPPGELVRRAVANGVTLLSITDHDTVDAYAQLSAANNHELRIVPGVEFSTQWRGHSIHVVGLGIDVDDETLAAAVRRQGAAREERAVAIDARLARLGFVDTLAGARRIAGSAQIGRPHFARHLVASGHAKDIATSFKKYLGPGKAGDVRQHWQSLATVVRWIIDAGGIAVLAHPAKYKMTNTKLGALTDEFASAGGRAIEVVCGQQSADVTKKLARLCNERSLYASCGSDFHAPGQPWSELGRAGAPPRDCRPVWELL